VTPDERQAIMSLVTVPGLGRQGSPEQVLDRFGSTDGPALGLRLLRDAFARRDADDIELALIVCDTFGVAEEHVEPLVWLLTVDWHHSHEEAARLLGQLRSPAAVDALLRAAQWVPAYLDYDDSRALATKAIWALGGTPGPEAERALRRLLDSDSEIVREEATAQLRRRERS
jgi:PBS lyase HEAT-like repeat